MTAIKLGASLMLPVCILISIILLVYGTIHNIKYLNSKKPLGRTLYATGNAASFLLWFSSIYIVSSAGEVSSAINGIIYLIVGYCFCILGFTFYFVTGMRRAYDIGFPIWVYPLYLILICVFEFISQDISDFLFLGLWVLLLQPGSRGKEGV